MCVCVKLKKKKGNIVDKFNNKNKIIAICDNKTLYFLNENWKLDHFVKPEHYITEPEHYIFTGQTENIVAIILRYFFII